LIELPQVGFRHVHRLLSIALTTFAATTASADSSSPRLASYYHRHLAICGGEAYEWSGDEQPRKALRQVMQVGVGKTQSYALTTAGRLHTWSADARESDLLLEGVRYFSAGNSGVLAIKSDGSLWRVTRTGSGLLGRDRNEFAQVAAVAKASSVGDGTDYYVTASGELFARGSAHRGQYGDGRVEPTDGYVRVASNVADIKSHTGHALLLTDAGDVLGTGGNLYGPLGRHGLGDKAVRWGRIFDDATGIATGASHSLAIRSDGTLWIWGRNETPEPRMVLARVIGAAAGSDASIALTQDGGLWQWQTGQRPVRIMDCAP
jgi:alpha-tubulin suppressor-like RCC1 family protein